MSWGWTTLPAKYDQKNFLLKFLFREGQTSPFYARQNSICFNFLHKIYCKETVNCKCSSFFYCPTLFFAPLNQLDLLDPWPRQVQGETQGRVQGLTKYKPMVPSLVSSSRRHVQKPQRPSLSNKIKMLMRPREKKM